MGRKLIYKMTRRILGILRSYNLREQFAARQVPLKTIVHLALDEFTGKKHYRVEGHGRGITVYNATVEKILPIVIEALKTAGYYGSWGVEDPPLTTQILTTLRSFDPLPKEPYCHRCKQPLKVGDEVISIHTEYRNHIYHVSCYESMWL